jgi:hypothetical protein
MARPERFELPTLWFEAKSNGFCKSPAVSSNRKKPAFTAQIAMYAGVAGCARLVVGSLQKPLHADGPSR